jgi:CDP-paratose 2-epimerase
VCFGDGSQVRDLLHVDDLIKLYEMIIQGKVTAGSYVVGGSATNAYSFSEVVNLFGGTISRYSEWRDNDQRYFVSLNEGLALQGWEPKVNFKDRIQDLLKE